MRLLVTVVLVFLIGCVSCIREEVGEHIQYIQPGDALPEFMVEMNDGTILDRDSLRGKVSVLVFSILPVRIVSVNFRWFSNCMRFMLEILVSELPVSVGKNQKKKYWHIGKVML